jgi:tRNA U34 5-methylaminomethyl-2-thiouridine-forming methyltransferase MnmC
MDHLKLITTADGSHSVLNTQLNETYHSHHGALQESLHVFIKNGLVFFTDKNKTSTADVLEIGFGTGLNALLTLEFAVNSGFNVRYTTIESFPLAEHIWRELNYPQDTRMKEYFHAIHRCAWGKDQNITDNFRLLKIHDTIQQHSFPEGFFDVVYFDAFAPSKQPEMWDLQVLESIVKAMRTKAVFVTYCAKGQLKRDLKSLGVAVETLPGAPGKKEMTRAVKVS